MALCRQVAGLVIPFAGGFNHVEIAKVREGEGTFASTRGACAPQKRKSQRQNRSEIRIILVGSAYGNAN